MPYQVDRFNGTFLVSVDDGTIDTTTDIRFVGKNYAGYGEVQNENFLHLLENFANTSPPPKVISGQIWFDSATKKLKFYDGTRFKVAGGAEVSATAPSNLATGEFWWDSSAQQLYAYNGNEYVLVGPADSPDLGTAAIVAQVVKDNLNVNHSIAKLQSGGDTIAIISKDSFTLNSVVNPITGFSVIKKGVNLVNTSGTSGITATDHYFWGTASNSLKLGGFAAEDFVRSGSAELTSGALFGDTGFTLGNSAGPDIRFYVENGDEPIIENLLGNPVKVRITISPTDKRDVAVFGPLGVTPGTNNFYNLGSTSSKWANIFATTFNGNLIGNVTGNVTGNHIGNVVSSTDATVLVDSAAKTFYGTLGSPLQPATVFGNVLGDLTGTANNALTLNSKSESVSATINTIASRDTNGNITANRFLGIADHSVRLKIDDAAADDPGSSYKSAKTTATGNTIAARNSAGDLFANYFRGTATAAAYADLAEIYKTDKQYEVGTVVAVGGEAEVRSSQFGDLAIGVISQSPAYLMNKDAEGQAVALKGRVPVKITGRIKKGDRLAATDNGCAIKATIHQHADVFAIALEDSENTDIKLIECVIL